MTKRKARYKSVLPSLLTTLLCLFSCVGSLWLFYKDLTFSSSRTDKEAMATITFKYRIVQRKYRDRVVWERLRQYSPLYNGDTIHTADLAQATMHFNSGAKIEIGENSMVQILVGYDGTVKLNINGGNVDADTSASSESVLLDLGNGTVINVQEGSRISAMLDKSQEGTSVKVLSGDAFINDTQGGVNSLAAGQSVELYKDGKVVKKPVTVTSVSENQKVFIFGDDEKEKFVSLEWLALEDNSKNVVVQTSCKKDFSEIRDTFEVQDTSKVDIPTSDKNTIYWRVYLEDDAENTVEGRIYFEELAPLNAKWPLDNKLFTYYDSTPAVNFAWEGNEYIQKYKLEICKDENFANPVIVKEVTTQNVVLNNLEEGKYFWRVTPYYANNNIGYYGSTAAKSLTIVRKNEVVEPAPVESHNEVVEPLPMESHDEDLPPPVLSKRLENKKIGADYLAKNRSIAFAWDSVEGATDYSFVLYKKSPSGTLKEIYSNKNVKDTQLRITELTILDIGEFQWQVSAQYRAKDGSVDKQSKSIAQNFIIDFELPGKIEALDPGEMYGE